MPLTAIFDIDGTLVDTNYQHALAWYRAFRQNGLVMPIWQIHRAIGVGSDRVVEMLAGEQVEQEFGETLRAAEGPLYQEMIDEVEPMKRAHELLRDLKRAGHTVILASSAEEEDAERYIELLDATGVRRRLHHLCRRQADQARARHRPRRRREGRRRARGHDRRQHLGLQGRDPRASSRASASSPAASRSKSSQKRAPRSCLTPLSTSASTSRRRTFRTR